MLHDSLDVGILAENVRLLQKEINEAESKLPTPEAGDAGKVLTVNNDLDYSIAAVPSDLPTPSEGDAGKVLKVDGELSWSIGAIPTSSVNYSTSEVETNDVWIDNRPIYRKTYNVSNLTGSDVLEADFENYIIVNARGWLVASAGYGGCLGCAVPSDTRWYSGLHRPVDNTLVLISGSELNGGSATITIDYVKPSPVPSNETRKTTKKK